MCERKMSKLEAKGVASGKIPVFDEFGKFNEHGLAVVKKGDQFGVINKELELVVKTEYDSIKLLDNGIVVTHKGALYGLLSQTGHDVTSRVFATSADAEKYGSWF